jgi:hypothetical protein
MPRPVKNHAEATERARELHRTGRTRAQIKVDLLAMGHDVSTGWISNATAPKRKGGKDAPPTPKPTHGPPTGPRWQEAPTAPDPTDGRTDLALLAKMVANLEELTEVARAEGNLSGFAMMTRAINQSLALAAKLQPPAPVDPEASPDMIAAAERARVKMGEMLAGMLAGGAQ